MIIVPLSFPNQNSAWRAPIGALITGCKCGSTYLYSTILWIKCVVQLFYSFVRMSCKPSIDQNQDIEVSLEFWLSKSWDWLSQFAYESHEHGKSWFSNSTNVDGSAYTSFKSNLSHLPHYLYFSQKNKDIYGQSRCAHLCDFLSPKSVIEHLPRCGKKRFLDFPLSKNIYFFHICWQSGVLKSHL